MNTYFLHTTQYKFPIKNLTLALTLTPPSTPHANSPNPPAQVPTPLSLLIPILPSPPLPSPPLPYHSPTHLKSPFIIGPPDTNIPLHVLGFTYRTNQPTIHPSIYRPPTQSTRQKQKQKQNALHTNSTPVPSPQSPTKSTRQIKRTKGSKNKKQYSHVQERMNEQTNFRESEVAAHRAEQAESAEGSARSMHHSDG